MVRTVGRVYHRLALLLHFPYIYMGVDRQSRRKCVGGHFYIVYVHRPINPLAACSHMHTRPGLSDLREVLQEREDTVQEQASHQWHTEEAGEEGEEEKVRLVYFTPRISLCKQYVFDAGVGNNKTVCALWAWERIGFVDVSRYACLSLQRSCLSVFKSIISSL